MANAPWAPVLKSPLKAGCEVSEPKSSADMLRLLGSPSISCILARARRLGGRKVLHEQIRLLHRAA